MLIVRKTNRVTPWVVMRTAFPSNGVDYYLPIVLDDEQTGTQIAGNREVKFVFSDGPLEEETQLLGTMEDSHFTSWKQLLDNYPLKEDKLHNCTHVHVDGEINLIPKTLSIPTMADHKAFNRSYSSTRQIGKLYYVDGREPLVTMPEPLPGKTNPYTVYCLPGANVHNVCVSSTYSINGKTATDFIYSDVGSRYLGKGSDFGWTKNPEVAIWAFIVHLFDSKRKPITRVEFCYTTEWLLKGWWCHYRKAVDFPYLLSINSIGFEAMLKREVPGSGEFTEYGPWNGGSFPEIPEPMRMWDRVPSTTLDLLTNRYITDEVRSMATYAVSCSTQDAVLREKVLDINTLMYLRDFTELQKLLDSYLDLFRKGINPKTVAGAYLASWYGVRLSVKDTKKIIRAAKRLTRTAGKLYAYSYGQKTHTCSNGVKLKANVSVAYGLYDQKLLRFLSVLSTLDAIPTPSRVWDMIPYTFLADWVLPFGTSLEAYDAWTRLLLVEHYRACNSVEATKVLDPGLFNGLPGSLNAIGKVVYTRYVRTYTANPAPILPWLRIDEIDPSWNRMRFLSASALIVQRS